jgi:PAS domain-containing protein
MILIRRYVLILLLLATCGFLLVLGTRGYLLLRGAEGLSGGELKIQSENLVYLAIVFVGVAAVFVFGLAARSRNITRELDKIIDIARYGSFSFEESLRRMGPLGDKIQGLNTRLADLNEKKSLRISALAAINAFLINNIRLPVLITDITGKVTAVSPRAVERLGQERASIVGLYVKEVIPEADFQQVVSRLEKEHVELKVEGEGDPVTYFPILNRSNEVANVICLLGKEEVISAAATRSEERPRGAAVSRMAKFVRKALRVPGRPTAARARSRGEPRKASERPQRPRGSTG